MPLVQNIVGVLPSNTGERFDVVVDFFDKKPEYVSVMDGKHLITSFWFDQPTPNCDICQAARRIISRAHRALKSDNVIDWEDIARMKRERVLEQPR